MSLFIIYRVYGNHPDVLAALENVVQRSTLLLLLLLVFVNGSMMMHFIFAV